MTVAALVAFLVAHPALVAAVGSMVGLGVGRLLTAKDRALLTQLEDTGLVRAHPEVIPLLETGNALLMGAIQDAATVAGVDLSNATNIDQGLANKIAADAWAAARKRLLAEHPETTAKGLTAVGGMGPVDEHFEAAAQGMVKVLTKAPSGRALVKVDPNYPEPPKVA